MLPDHMPLEQLQEAIVRWGIDVYDPEDLPTESETDKLLDAVDRYFMAGTLREWVARWDFPMEPAVQHVNPKLIKFGEGDHHYHNPGWTIGDVVNRDEIYSKFSLSQ